MKRVPIERVKSDLGDDLGEEAAASADSIGIFIAHKRNRKAAPLADQADAVAQAMVEPPGSGAAG